MSLSLFMTIALAAPAFLVVAPDRGFLGNEETRDAFEAFAPGRNAALAFVTDERTGATLEGALRSIAEGGARRVVVLPFFLSRSDPRYARVASVLAARPSGLAIQWARPYGESYFAVEQLADRMRAIERPRETRVVVVGAGARDDDARRGMLPDWERLAERASAGLGFASVRAVLETSTDKLGSGLADAASGGRTVVIPFHLGSKLDGMMSYTAAIRSAAPKTAELIESDLTPDPSVALWMNREANRQSPLRAGDVGVVVLAHGADHHWNETMRQAVAPLAERYKIEPAFSMADPVVIGRAVHRLEARGARFIVILRLFGLTSSFRTNVERLIGFDVESGAAPDPHAGHMMMGHDPGDASPPPRLRSPAAMVTTGGIEDAPLFADALLLRAQSLSRDPSRETVILVAHGAGDDAEDAHWQELLASLARRMRETGGQGFRAIRTATWREDWPDKRAVAVEHVRTMVQEASADGGRAIVIPARMLGQGPERRLLEGLTFELGEGFAPLPLFAQWAGGEVAAAVAEETKTREAATAGTIPQRTSSGPPPEP